ncbi:MAG: arsenic efflux protein [Lachnospiraceae bacterium]|nr:arsenic efflux protein [Lachnospiraceae bacterium]
MLDILLDALIDTAKLLPFLFATYLAMEYLEHKTSVKVLIAVQKAGNFGPLIGGALGAVPQCGFSAAASSLYAGKIISIGTLIAIYLSTSDEMLPMLISEKAPVSFILSVIGVKLLIGIFWGFLCDLVFFRNENAHEHINIHTMCEEEHCHCDKGIWGSALKHALKIALFIFVISLALGFIIETVGAETISGTVLNHKIFGPLIASLVGLIPNCASSVILTQMYLEGVISAGPMLAGLLTGAGVGWMVLLRASKNVKKTLKVVSLVYVFGALSGMIIGLFF